MKKVVRLFLYIIISLGFGILDYHAGIITLLYFILVEVMRFKLK